MILPLMLLLVSNLLFEFDNEGESSCAFGTHPISVGPRCVSDHLQILKVRSPATGEFQRIETTDEHPFWVTDHGWVKAADLKPGDELTDSENGTAIVLANTHEAHEEGIPVFNFEVADLHTYHVRAGGTRGPPLWVHNDCNFVSLDDVEAAARQFSQRNATTRSLANRNLTRAEWKALYREQRLQRQTSSAYKQRFDQTPVYNGSWSNGRAESTFTSTHPSVSGRSVNYQNAYADLTPFAKHTVEIDDFGSIVRNVRNPRYDLHKQADAMLGARLGLSSKLIKKFRTKNNFTWHEVQDMRTLQLVPTDINSKFGHLGGISEALGQ